MSEPLFDVADLVEPLDPELRDWYDERAAIREFDGGQERWLAESLAMLDLLRAHPAALTQFALVKVERRGRSVLILTTDIEGDRKRLSSYGNHLSRVARVDLALDEHFDGLARLISMPR